MGDLRNKIEKLLRAEREARAGAAWLQQHYSGRPMPPAAPPPTCSVCGTAQPYCLDQGWMMAPLYVCGQHLPEWAMLAVEGHDERQDRMCNLYSVTTSQEAIRALARAMGEWRDMAGNMPRMPAIFPDKMAPVVHTAPDGARELVMMRWGWPPRPPIPGERSSARPITNVRNTASRFWAPWLRKPEHRCIVPVTAFCEPDNGKGPKSVWTWFAQDEARSPFFFAGIWREWEGARGTKADPVVGKHLVFSFLTTDASPDVAPVHPDASPVLLLDQQSRETWLNAPIEEAILLQRPAPPGAVHVVRTGTKEDA